VDVATPFIDVASLSYSVSTSGGASMSFIDLSGIPALQNVPDNIHVTFRIVNFGGTNPGGTWYIFDVASNSAPDLVIDGVVSIAFTNPATAPTLSAPIASNNQFSFTLTGTSGMDYVVQTSTNLTGGTWISLQTNAAPFTFIESNLNAFPQRFYRGVVAP
jgi:hypothetical protein